MDRVCAPRQVVGKLARSGKRPRYMAGRRVAELVRRTGRPERRRANRLVRLFLYG